MAKRFTDSDKWKDPWFRGLGTKLREVRLFILDDCDNAGIWKIDLKRLAYSISQPSVTLEEVKSCFKEDLVIKDDCIFIPEFISFQYASLNPRCNAHRSVLEKLKNFGFQKDPIMIPSGWDQDKDEDKDKYKDKDKDKDKDSEDAASKKPRSLHPEISDQVDRVLYATRKFGYIGLKDAESYLGSEIWDKLKSFGRWSDICQHKHDEFFKKRVKDSLK